ncbi:hypothetical protein BsWGS_24290 [Bradybaena similaris]
MTNYSSLEHLFTSSIGNTSGAKATDKENTLFVTRLIVQKLCVPLVVFIGVVGNSLSLVVLTRKCMRSSTNSYLTALALFDLLYLLFSFTLSLNHYRCFSSSYSYVHWFPVARVFTDMFANVSVILTVTFTVERYIGVCHPMKGRIICTSQRAKHITAIVSTVAILCTAPEFWEMEVVNRRVNNQTVARAVYTELASTPSYEIGYYWFFVCMFTLLPLVLLCVFNGILICTVIKAARLRKEMTLLAPVRPSCKSNSSSSNSVGRSQSKEQQKITKMLITVVLAFIVCQLPGALLLLVKTYNALAGVQLSKDKETNLRIAGNVTNLLIQTNAAINFILYSAISTKFRRVFHRVICRGRKCVGWRQDAPQTMFTRTDGVQLSSFYGDKAGSKATSSSTYTVRIRLSQKSARSEAGAGQSDREETLEPWPRLGRQVNLNRKHTLKQTSGNDYYCLSNSRHSKLPDGEDGQQLQNQSSNPASTELNNPCCKRNNLYFIWKV